ncbi:MAG: S46 family peptidase [Byssovorax sp.]
MVRSRSHLSALALVVLAAVASACDPEAPPPVTPPPPDPPLPPVATSVNAPPPAVKPPKPLKTTFENPGGMWMPEQLPEQAATMKAAGLEIDPGLLSQPTSEILGAVVSLGGCTSSFVSDEGLIITNHHCATGALQFNSTPKENLLVDGYLAKTRADERWAGPTARIFVTQASKDVTRDVRDGLEKIKSDKDRHDKIEEHEKALVAACEKDRPGLRCTVAEYFGGQQFRLIEQLEIKDVRLVFAPHEGVGNFGGEIDNWRWPRHDGDVSMFRAYVGKDGKPADHSAENVPYHPPRRLKLASKPLEAGDFVMVAGYPGQTNRLRTADEVEDNVGWGYPYRIKFCEENLALLDTLTKGNPDLKIKATPFIRGLGNTLTKFRGIEDGLGKGGLAEQKKKEEADLKTWVLAEPARKASYGDVLDKMTKLSVQLRKTREADAALSEVYRMVSLINSAGQIVRMAEERPKADAKRDPAFQERNWQRMEQAEASGQKRYDRALDKALLKLALQRAVRIPGKDRVAVLTTIVGKGDVTDAKIDAAIEALYTKTSLEDLDGRVKLLKTATTADLKKSKDPLIQLALKLRPLQKAVNDRTDAYDGAMATLKPLFIEALQKHSKTPLAPDANSTLRVTYGTVRGYRPSSEAKMYTPFTVVSEMVKKHTGVEPFNAPAAVLDAIKAGKFGPYVDQDLGEVPIDFLSDLDITGGNSGSATLNSRGELVGLAFDGNYESMASDWLFMPSVTRTIHVDLRYILWLLDAAYPGDHLLKEMGVTPAIP